MKYLPIGGEVIIVPSSIRKSGALLLRCGVRIFRRNGDWDSSDADAPSASDRADRCSSSPGEGDLTSLSLPFGELSIVLGDSESWNRPALV